MNKITLGDWFDGGQAKMDLARLLAARLLLQAGSGFGKSWALRRLLEQTAGGVQQFIIDPEGEFATLREKHDYVIAAVNGGDALAHPRTAGLLLRRLMETGVSAILDISELKKPERRRFVRLFVEELMGLPRAMWSPLLVVVDEGHEFAPEKDEAESLSAVVDLATRGRKRGFALVVATQRIGKLSKDVAAELHNKLIGFTSLDIDVKRAAFELGMTPKDANEALRALKPGDFYAFGPATSQTVQRLHVGEVFTTHPEPGAKKFRAPPKPTDAIKAVLPKLADLPKEAEEEARTVEELRKENAQLKRDAKAVRPTAPAPKVDASASRRDATTIKRLQSAIEGLMKFVVTINATGFAQGAGVDPEAMQKAIQSAVDQAMKLVDANLAGRDKTLQALQREGGRIIAQVKKLLADQEVVIDVDVKHNQPFTVAPARSSSPVKTPVKTREKSNGAGDSSLPRGEAQILAACIQFPNGLRREQLTVLTTYKRSTRDRYVLYLKEKGFVDQAGDLVVATDAGRNALPDAQPLPTGDDLRDHWLAQLPEGERKLLEVCIAAYPDAVSRDVLTQQTGYQRSTRDRYLLYMFNKQVVVRDGSSVRASEDLF